MAVHVPVAVADDFVGCGGIDIVGAAVVASVGVADAACPAEGPT